MSDLYAIGYPNLLAAEQVVDTITQLQARGMIDIDDAVIVERRGGDKVKLHQVGSGKAHWVGRIGHVLAGSGRSSGDAGIDAEFTRDLGAQLDAGNVALVMLVSSVVADKVLDELHGQHSGHIMQTSLDQQSETALNEAAEQAREAHRGLFN